MRKALYGTFLGMFIGVIVITCFLFFDLLCGAILLPFSTIYFYLKFGGTKNHTGVLICIIFILIGGLISFRIGEAVNLSTNAQPEAIAKAGCEELGINFYDLSYFEKQAIYEELSEFEKYTFIYCLFNLENVVKEADKYLESEEMTDAYYHDLFLFWFLTIVGLIVAFVRFKFDLKKQNHVIKKEEIDLDSIKLHIDSPN